MNTKKLIIPAAGFGVRRGLPPAKELLPGTQGFPMIEFSLRLGFDYQIPCHIILRKEKRELIEYLKSHRMFGLGLLEIQEIDPTPEWPSTVLTSQKFWADRNVLILPDTEFSPRHVIESMLASEQPLQAATFQVPDPAHWGIIQNIQAGSFEIADKPQIQTEAHSRAWGLLGFKKQYGEILFTTILKAYFSGREAHLVAPGKASPESPASSLRSFERIPLDLEVFSLDSFRDLGRMP